MCVGGGGGSFLLNLKLIFVNFDQIVHTEQQSKLQRL